MIFRICGSNLLFSSGCILSFHLPNDKVARSAVRFGSFNFRFPVPRPASFHKIFINYHTSTAVFRQVANVKRARNHGGSSSGLHKSQSNCRTKIPPSKKMSFSSLVFRRYWDWRIRAPGDVHRLTALVLPVACDSYSRFTIIYSFTNDPSLMRMASGFTPVIRNPIFSYKPLALLLPSIKSSSIWRTSPRSPAT